MSSLIIKDLKKTYSNGVQALKGINLTINTGMYGLLGPNGAGKSTLMRTIATLQEADEGSIFLDDLNVLEQKHEVRQILGFLPQEFDVYPKASCYELLNHLAVLKGMSNGKKRKEAVNILLEKTNLQHHRNKLLGSFSGGMRQRFGIAQALLNNPKLLIVDEPTAGLDPEERNRLLNILGELGENIIVILSTHIVDDVTELCNSMAIINLGEVLIENHPEYVVNQLKDKIYRKVIEKEELEKIMDFPPPPPPHSQAHEGGISFLSSKMYMGKIMVHVYAETNPGNDFTLIHPNLEDAYFYYIRGLG
jgi:ABC-type multidrug transport system ATPase subunit